MYTVKIIVASDYIGRDDESNSTKRVFSTGHVEVKHATQGENVDGDPTFDLRQVGLFT